MAYAAYEDNAEYAAFGRQPQPAEERDEFDLISWQILVE
jgi:hypothetical protein